MAPVLHEAIARQNEFDPSQGSSYRHPSLVPLPRLCDIGVMTKEEFEFYSSAGNSIHGIRDNQIGSTALNTNTNIINNSNNHSNTNNSPLSSVKSRNSADSRFYYGKPPGLSTEEKTKKEENGLFIQSPVDNININNNNSSSTTNSIINSINNNNKNLY